jgi:LuxR family maltose regulon positive regulatory protein
VLELLPTHLSTAAIGEALHISRNTVKAHLRTIYRKLDVATRADAVERATRHGLLRLGDA